VYHLKNVSDDRPNYIGTIPSVICGHSAIGRAMAPALCPKYALVNSTNNNMYLFCAWGRITWPWFWFHWHWATPFVPVASVSSQYICRSYYLLFVLGRLGPFPNPGTSQFSACCGMRGALSVLSN